MNEDTNNKCLNAEEFGKVADQSREKSIEGHVYTNKSVQEVEGVLCEKMHEEANKGFKSFDFILREVFIKPEDIQELKKSFEGRGYTLKGNYVDNNSFILGIFPTSLTRPPFSTISIQLD